MKICVFFILFGLAHGATWSYVGDTGIHYWNQITGAHCNGQNQSPIDIPSSQSGHLMYDSSLGQLNLVGYDNMSSNHLKIKNNGHTVVIEITNFTTVPYMENGGLPGRYEAVQAHFHWGKNNHEGSEHSFRGMLYPLELHIVHKKTSYPTLTEALDARDGLAVLGFFFVESEEDNEHLVPVIDALKAIIFKSQVMDVNINFSDLMSEKKTEFYRYNGSLTTPMCNEAVVWTVFENKVPISAGQLGFFRQLYEMEQGKGFDQIEWNYRPVQELFNRKVYRNYQPDVPESYHWGYEGHEAANSWPAYYPTCSGDRQSPINIPGDHDPMLLFNPSMKLNTLMYTNYNTTVTGTIKNNGHTIQVDLNNTDITINQGGLGSEYQAAQFHFHWGPDNMHGSEHTRDGRSYPLELHIVHFKKQYRTLADAVYRHDGLAVLGYFFEVGGGNNPGYANIISKLPDVKYKGLNQMVTGFTMEDLTFPYLYNNVSGDQIPFFRYQGGLTTPPCFEVVTWTVMMPTVKISAAQMAEFRKMMHVTQNESHDVQGKIKKNYRPPQDLRTRPVFTSYDLKTTATASISMPTYVTTLVAILAFTIFSR